MKYTRYSWPRNFYDMRCELGQEFESHWGRVIFVRLTRKGFNFFIPSKNRLVRLNGHYYDRRFSHINIPSRQTVFKVKLPEWLFYDLKKTRKKEEPLNYEI